MPSKRLFVFLAFCLLLFALPLGLTRIIYHRVWDRRDEAALDAARERFEALIAQQRFRNRGIADLSDHIRSIIVGARIRPGFQGEISSIREILHRQFRGQIQVIYLDRTGAAVPFLSDLSFPADLGRSLISDLAQAERGDLRGVQKRIGEYRKYFGPVLACRRRLGAVNAIERLDYRGRWIYGFFSPVGRTGLLIVLFGNKADWRLFPPLFQLRGMRTSYPELGGAMVDIRRPVRQWKHLLKASTRELEEVLKNPQSLDRGICLVGNRFWAQQTIRDSWRIILSWPAERDRDSPAARRMGDLLLLLALAAGCGLAWHFLMGKGIATISVRVKIGALLLYVIGVPLLLLVAAGYDFLREHEESLVQETFQRQEHLIREFDRDFRRGMGKMVVAIRRDLCRPLPARGNPVPLLQKRMERLERQYRIGLCTLVDSRGKALYQTREKQAKEGKAFLTALQNTAADLLNTMGNVAGEARRESARDQFIKVTGDMFGFNMEKIVAHVAQRLGELVTVLIGRFELQLTMIPVRDVAGIPRFIGVFGWDNLGIHPAWVEKRFSAWRKRVSLTGMAEVRNRVFGNTAEFRAVRKEFRPRVEQSILPIRHRFEEEGRRWLVTGFRGHHLGTCLFFLFSDDSRIQAELQRTMVPFAILILSLLAVGWGVAAELARRFLLPVGHLMRGVEAMQHRRFDQPIPLVQLDELGSLTLAFNDMLDGMKELEVAKILQENLFPSGPLHQGGWMVSGACQAASRVGGDYFDYFALPDGRILLLIGDVSGHGSSAALVVAMAKALIAHPDTVHEPGPVLDLMQGVFAASLQRRKMMSCFCAVFDPAGGILHAANAGHNLPYLVRAGGAVEQLKTGGKPLGTKNKPFVTREYRLAPDDWLFLYTDGFIEAQATDGREIGYDRVETMISGLRGRDAAETRGRLWKWQTGLAAPGPQADDITVVILQRQPSPEVQASS